MKTFRMLTLIGTTAILAACSSETIKTTFPDIYKDHHYWAARQALNIGEPEDAPEHFKNAASMDHYDSMTWLGHLYSYGTGINKDPAEALKWYEKAVNDPSERQMNLLKRLGDIYSRGQGTDVNQEKANQYWEKALAYYNAKPELTTSEAQVLGSMYAYGLGTPADGAKAVEILEKHYIPGRGSIARLLGDIYFDGNGLRQDYKKASEWYLESVENGDPVRLNRLAQIYAEGLGVEIDLAASQKYYRENVSYLESLLGDGITNSQVRDLAYLYSEGRGVEKPNGLKAIELLQPITNNDGGVAERIIGDIYFEGKGLETADEVHAVEWYEKAIEQGDKARLPRVAELYYSSKTVKRDVEKAQKYWNISLKELETLGDKRSPSETRRLAYMYADGQGVKANGSKAVELLTTITSRGGGFAERLIGDIYYAGTGFAQPDFKESLKWYSKAAEEGSIARLQRVGDMYRDGQGTSKNEALANKYWKMAVDAFVAKGASRDEWETRSLAYLYTNGQGVEKNLERALELLTELSDKGDVYSSRQAGDIAYDLKSMEQARALYKKAIDGKEFARLERYAQMVEKGIGGPALPDEAHALYRTLAQTYEKEGSERYEYDTLRLARFYMEGKGVNKDIERGLALLKELSPKIALASIELGDHYYSGQIVEQDFKAALDWYKKSIDMGDRSRVARLASMYERGNGVQVNLQKAEEILKLVK